MKWKCDNQWLQMDDVMESFLWFTIMASKTNTHVLTGSSTGITLVCYIFVLFKCVCVFYLFKIQKNFLVLFQNWKTKSPVDMILYLIVFLKPPYQQYALTLKFFLILAFTMVFFLIFSKLLRLFLFLKVVTKKTVTTIGRYHFYLPLVKFLRN